MLDGLALDAHIMTAQVAIWLSWALAGALTGLAHFAALRRLTAALMGHRMSLPAWLTWQGLRIATLTTAAWMAALSGAGALTCFAFGLLIGRAIALRAGAKAAVATKTQGPVP